MKHIEEEMSIGKDKMNIYKQWRIQDFVLGERVYYFYLYNFENSMELRNKFTILREKKTKWDK